MKLILVRHGQTDWNILNLLQGSTDMPLNENGRATARKLGELLANEPITEVYCSDLSRARETASIIIEGRNIPLTCDRRLREIDFGPFEGEDGLGWTPENKFEHPFFTDPANYIPPAGVETFRELLARTKDFLATVIEPMGNVDKTILIAAHNASCKALSCNLENIPVSEFWSGDGRMQNCECRCFTRTENGWEKAGRLFGE